jgi:hypothetical protein
VFDTARLVGMAKLEAVALCKKQGYSPYIVKENGKMFDPPMDYVPKLVNLTVRDGMVTKAELDEVEY